MRVATWNCQVGNFQGKAAKVATLGTDVLVVPEVERFTDATLFKGAAQPKRLPDREN